MARRPPLILEKSQGQAAQGKNLVGPQAIVDRAGLVIDVDDIVKAAAGLVPKALLEGLARFFIGSGPVGQILPGQAQRVEPKRLDFDRLADARRDDPVADLGIHPSQLHARHAAGQQPIGIAANAVARAVAVAGEDGIDRGEEESLVLGFDRGQLQKFTDHHDVPQRGRRPNCTPAHRPGREIDWAACPGRWSPPRPAESPGPPPSGRWRERARAWR